MSTEKININDWAGVIMVVSMFSPVIGYAVWELRGRIRWWHWIGVIIYSLILTAVAGPAMLLALPALVWVLQQLGFPPPHY